MEMNQELLKVLAEKLVQEYGFSTQTQLDKAIADLIKRGEERRNSEKGKFSYSTLFRGLRAMKNECINERTKEADIAYVKTLTTGATPGSYLVPTIQADEIIGFLETGGIARAAGVRVWPMNGIQKMNVPAAT